jgi:hypothetical protein
MQREVDAAEPIHVELGRPAAALDRTVAHAVYRQR